MKLEVSTHSFYSSLIFWGLLFFQILPVWLFPYFPSVDGPSHIENAWILKELIFGTNHTFNELYQINNSLVANWPSHIMLSIFLMLTSPASAEKLLVTIYFIAFALSFCFLVTTLTKDSIFSGIIGFPFISNIFLHFGFYNFCLSLCVMFWVIEKWISNEASPSSKSCIIISALLVAILIFHPFTYAITLMSLAILTACHRISNGKQILLLRQDLFTFPSLILFLFWIFRKSLVAQPSIEGPSYSARFFDLATLSSLQGISQDGAVITVLFFLFLTILTRKLILHRDQQKNSICFGFGLIGLLFFTLSVFGPYGLVSGFFLGERFAYIGTIFIVLMLCMFGPTKKYIFIGSLCIAITLPIFRWYEYKEPNALIQEFLTVTSLIPPSESVAQVNGYSEKTFLPFLDHTIGYLIPSAGLVNVMNYESRLTDFPIRRKINAAWDKTDLLPRYIVDVRYMENQSFTMWPNHLKEQKEKYSIVPTTSLSMRLYTLEKEKAFTQ